MSEEMESQEIQEKKYAVTDLDSASRVMKKIKFLDKEIEKIKLQAEKERAEIDEWEKSEVKTLKGKRGYFSGLIEYYYKEQRHFNSKFRLSTPWGKISSRKSYSLTVADEQGSINYFEFNDKQAVKIKKALDKNYIKTKYKNGIDPETGEIIPGIKFEEKESFTITTKIKEKE